MSERRRFSSVSRHTREAIEWYSRTRPTFQALANKVESILREVIDENSINYHSISSRAKTMESYERKASRGKYRDPRQEIMDMAGVRVVTYTQSDATWVANVVRELFNVLPKHSGDKAQELGTDKVGYRSIHFVATLGKRRQQLPENKVFRGLSFEIQVRTILQHAWAEFEHDRNYKFAGVLPTDMKRRLSILAGSLEMIDREFDTIANEVDRYSTVVDKKAESGNFAVPIDSTSLRTYLRRRFQALLDNGLVPTFYGRDQDVIGELRDMGITALEDLERIIPQNFVETKSRYIRPGKTTYTALLRDIMIIHNADQYFQKAWKKHWDEAEVEDAQFFEQFGVNLARYAKKYRFTIPRIS